MLFWKLSHKELVDAYVCVHDRCKQETGKGSGEVKRVNARAVAIFEVKPPTASLQLTMKLWWLVGKFRH
jgi:hypothetical protein